MARQIIVQILGDATKFNQATSQATGAAGKFGNVLQGIGQGIGISAFGGIAGAASQAASKIVDFATDSIGAASDLREAMALTDQVFEGSSGTIEKWGDTTAETMGSSKAEAISMAAIFGTQFKAVGYSIDETADKSINLSELAGDLGSAFNTSSQEAATALRSGLLGESEPLRKFGVNLSEARVKAYLLANGMKPVNGAFTDGQKVMARYNLILQDTTDSQGMFGRDAESLADTQKSLTAEMTDLQSEIGTALLPIMVDLAKFVRDDMIPAVRDLQGFVATLSPVWDDLMNSMDPQPTYKAKSALGELDQTLTDVTDNVIDALTPWDGYTSAELDHARAAKETTGEVKKLAREHQNATDAVEAAKTPTDNLTGSIGNLGDEAALTTSQVRDLKRSVEDAMGQMIEDSYAPEQLRLALLAAKEEGGGLERKLRDLEAIKNPTAEQRQDIIDTRLEISKNHEETDKLTTSIGLLNGASLAEIRAAFATLKKNGIDPDSAAARTLLNLLNAAESAAERTGQKISRTGTAYQARASGGSASGLTWVGEMGPELVNLPAGSYVHSNAESMRMPSGRGGSPITIVVQGSVYGDMDQFADRLALRLRLAGA